MSEPSDLNARDEEDARLRELQAQAAKDYAEAQDAREQAAARTRDHAPES